MKKKIIAKLFNCFIAATEKNNLTMQQCNNRKSQKGFTLIELLVVIAIIGLLTSFLVANFVGVKERARDAQRKSDLRQIQAALEIYRSDKGSYPLTSMIANPCTPGTSWTDGSTYMQDVPCDPLNTEEFVYTYTYDCKGPDTGTYCLVACLENTSDSQKDSANDPKCTSGVSFTLKNP